MKKIKLLIATIIISTLFTGCGWGAKEQGVLIGAGGVLLLPTMYDNGKKLFGVQEQPKRVIHYHRYEPCDFCPRYR